jgi:serine/threonine-protein kinase RsbW
MDSDPVVRLTLPARPEFVRLARLVIAGLAGRHGFSYEDVEDLRIAVDELCFLVVGQVGHDGEIALSFTMKDDSLEVEGQGGAALVELSPFSQRIGRVPLLASSPG